MTVGILYLLFWTNDESIFLCMKDSFILLLRKSINTEVYMWHRITKGGNYVRYEALIGQLDIQPPIL